MSPTVQSKLSIIPILVFRNCTRWNWGALQDYWLVTCQSNHIKSRHTTILFPLRIGCRGLNLIWIFFNQHRLKSIHTGSNVYMHSLTFFFYNVLTSQDDPDQERSPAPKLTPLYQLSSMVVTASWAQAVLPLVVMVYCTVYGITKEDYSEILPSI